MNKTAVKVTGTLASLTLLAGTGAVVATAATNSTAGAESQAGISTASATAGVSHLVNASHVEGTFSYNQDVLTSNKVITDVFCKAATSLCSSLPDYGISDKQAPIDVTGTVGNAFSATVDDMADAEGTTSHVMACACASNLPGGGAIANAEVEGVSLESIMNRANVN